MSDSDFLDAFKHQQEKDPIEEIRLGHIYKVLPGPNHLSPEQAKLYLQDSQLLSHYQQVLNKLLKLHNLVDCIGIENLALLKSSLELISTASKHLESKDPSYHHLTGQCHQILCKISTLSNKNFFSHQNHLYQPLILELKDFLKTLHSKDEWQSYYVKLLHFVNPISQLLIGTRFSEQKKHLPEYSAAQKLIELLEHGKSPSFTAEERTQFYKGRLGQLIEKYHLNDSLLDDNTDFYLPIQK